MLIVEVLVIEVWEMGSRAAWLVFVVMILATAGTYAVRLYRGKWNTPEALERVLSEQ